MHGNDIEKYTVRSSVRKIQIDWQTVVQFSELIKGLPEDKPIFVHKKVYNSFITWYDKQLRWMNRDELVDMLKTIINEIETDSLDFTK